MRYDSRTSTWESLPARGLQVTMLYFADGTRRVIQNSLVVRWIDEQGEQHFEESETDVPAGTATMVWGPTAVEKEGSLLPDEIFNAILERAMNEWSAP